MTADAGAAYGLNERALRRDARAERLALFGLCSPALLLVLVILVIPVGWLFYVSCVGADGGFSLENYRRMLERRSYARIFRTTFEISVLTTALCVLIGYPLAYFISPLVVLVVGSALQSYDMNQELAARSLGAFRSKACLTATLPQIRFAVITAALLSFLTSFDEVVVAMFMMFISGGDNATLTRNIFNTLRDQSDPTIAAISTVMIAITAALMALAQLFGRARER